MPDIPSVALPHHVVPETSALPASTSLRHSALVRVTHWIVALCLFALLLSGFELIVSHPRFYWGESGNIWTTPLFQIPIPASRSLVPTGYAYTLPDQNGWSRYLHFQAAWIFVLTGLLYLVSSLFTGHLRKDLIPPTASLSRRAIVNTLSDHLRFKRLRDAASYNLIQRLTYLVVLFVLTPLAIWTGLAMSPAFVSAFPATVTVLGGQQSARTIHFFVSLALLLFIVGHVLMVSLAGFRRRMRSMTIGSNETPSERP